MKLKIVVIGLIIFTSVALGFEGGDGSQGNPYQISNCQQLQEMSPNHGLEGGLSDHYELISDVDCSDTDKWNNGEGFNPVSDEANRFSGSLNGADYSVNEIYVNSGNFSGLIGFLDQGSSFGNISLIDVDITGTEFVGGAVGYNDGGTKSVKVLGNVNGIDKVGGITGYNAGLLISDSASLEGEFYGSVSGNQYVGGIVGESYGRSVENSIVVANIDGNSDVGGIAGYAYGSDIYRSAAYSIISANNRAGGVVGRKDSDIIQTYSSGSISADDYVGGLVGSSQQDVIDSYATSRIEGGANVGGALGSHSSGTIKDAYWDINSTNQTISDGGTGLTTSEMIGSNAESNMNLDFQETWDSQTYYYPRLQWMEPGSGTEADPYKIFSCQELQALQNNLTAHYVLANDIDCSDTVNWNNGFSSIGRGFVPFEGGLNGKGHEIRSLSIKRENSAYVGLFGSVDTPYSIINLRLKGVDVEGEQLVGAVVGDLDTGTLSRVSADGNVNGTFANIGGLVGLASSGSRINDSYFKGKVSGAQDSGGLIGQLFSGVVENSFVWANVTGDDDLGGFVGFSESGNYLESYSASKVSGPDTLEVNAFVGDHRGSEEDFESIYFDRNESGIENVWDGPKALRTSQMLGEACDMKGFSQTDWNFFLGAYPQLGYFTSENLFRNCNPISPPQSPSLFLPVDGATDVPIDTNLTVAAEGSGLMNITFYDNTSSSTVIGTVENVNASASEQASVDWSFRNESTTYDWYAVAENSAGKVTSQEWSFITEDKPGLTFFEPGHQSTVPVNPDLNVNVTDDISDDISVKYYDNSSSLIGEVTGLSSGNQSSLDTSLESFGSIADRSYEWYVVVETDSGASLNSSRDPGFQNFWSFETEPVLSISLDSVFGDGDNLNNGSADVGPIELSFQVSNDQASQMSSAQLSVDGSTVQTFNDFNSGETLTFDISGLGISQDRSSVPWTLGVTEGAVTETFSGNFSTHTVELTAEPQNNEHDQIRFYYSGNESNTVDDYRLIETVSASDSSNKIIAAANRELDSGLSDEHCFTASTSRTGLESSISTPVCVGGDIP